MSSIKSNNPQFATLFTAMECVLNGENAIYCSSELTSGLRAFNEMRKQRVKTSAELKDKLGSEWFPKIFGPNIELANQFAESVRRAEDGKMLVITPAPLKVQDWGQPEYNGFWTELLHSKRIESVRFNEDWQYSNGCTTEFVEAQAAEIHTLDVKREIIARDAAIELIAAAIKEFADLDTSLLQQNLDRLVATRTLRTTATVELDGLKTKVSRRR
jgi:uncharacterized protein YdcH (DUF465 family)